MEQSQRIEDAIYQRGRNRLDPRFEEQRARQTQDLANRGLSLTSEAYTGAEDRLGREQGEQLENLQLSAVEAGAQERSSLFDQALRTRSQLFGEQSTERQMGEQERSNLVREGFTERQVNEMEEMNTFTRAHQTRAAEFQEMSYERQQSEIERRNAAMEQAQGRQLTEQERANLVRETYQGKTLEESIRGNQAREGIARMGIAAQRAAAAAQQSMARAQLEFQRERGASDDAFRERQQVFGEQAYQRARPLDELTQLVDALGPQAGRDWATQQAQLDRELEREAIASGRSSQRRSDLWGGVGALGSSLIDAYF